MPLEVQKQSPEVFWKKVLKILEISQENTCAGVFLVKLQVFSQQVFKKETPTQMLSCEVWETLKNTYFEEHLLTTASEGVP